MTSGHELQRHARGGKGNTGGRANDVPREVVISKKLSWLLRHGAEQEGLKLGKGGYVPLQEVLENRKIKPLKVSLSEIQQIVVDNEKQRFSLIHRSSDQGSSDTTAQDAQVAVEDENDPSQLLIRANQGHSLKVEEEGLLTPITIAANNIPQMVVHGTRWQLWQQIVASGGLKPMTRNHIHFATGVPQSMQSSDTSSAKAETGIATIPDKKSPVTLSGMRSTSTLLMYLDIQKALNDGLKFWVSQNGVVLTDGGEKQLVDLQYFKKVEQLGGSVLVEDGKIIGKVRQSMYKKTKQVDKTTQPNLEGG